MSLPPVETLEIDVRAMDGTLLVPKGTEVDGDVVERLCLRGCEARFPQQSIDGTFLNRHLAEVTQESNYAVVFESRDDAVALLTLLGRLRVGAPVLSELDTASRADAYTYRHVLMTTVLSARMMRDLGASEDEILQAAYAALTHDFGKFRVPISILQKETPLTRRELRILRQHPVIGCVLLLYYLGENGTNVRVALGHHERPDGSGYPRHVHLADRLVRLIAVNDIFDALISPRPYRQQAFDPRGALEFLWAEVKAGRVDEAGCRLLVSYNRRNKPDPWSMTVSDEIRSPAPKENHYGCLADE